MHSQLAHLADAEITRLKAQLAYMTSERDRLNHEYGRYMAENPPMHRFMKRAKREITYLYERLQEYEKDHHECTRQS